MSKLDMLNLNGEKVKEINLKDNVWNIEPNDAVLYNALILAGASRRQGSHSTKTRSEVSGGGRKPWRQKGTGNARQGSTRSPQWRHGGIVFALLSSLSYKALDNELVVLEKLELESNKTKEMISLLEKLNLVDSKVLLVVEELNDNVCLASRNLGNVKVVLPNEVCTYDVVNCDKLVITNEALSKLEEVLSCE